MKILVNRNIKKLFCFALLLMMTFVILSIISIILRFEYAAFFILFCSVCMSVAVLIQGYSYFKVQNEIMENAAEQIKEYISGNQSARIECDDEGELYRLFHEVNSLVSILNAHAENEEKSKHFLKDTISDISHQLKTPLAALNVYNGIMQEEAKDYPTIKEFTTLSEQALDRIETLIQNLLNITKLDSGTILIEKSEESISVMMNSMAQQFAFRAKQEGKKIVLSGNNDITFLCDRHWLVEAISNFVKNALDHTQRDNKIYIGWKQFASVVQVVIKDNGSGIHPEDLPHIFKRFYRSRFSKDTQGIGLGLPLAKAIIEAHSGTIEVDSTLGHGSTFTITFLNPTKL
ncbi:sensor histidine kinase [Anaeromicropila populeti]|uniref:histidine kinase n=1 Tax=Anaeromicropila populeti TaxID=37658 RepID=A0A1I6J0B8_9FIRM|nr:HAMP domain-containing sensor histidine kinase [Anaeromicropila populeti]SFR71970.1 Signal transduction histidine kinase [Anaeromicropila populeti]